jgi:predicted dehydrogenase
MSTSHRSYVSRRTFVQYVGSLGLTLPAILPGVARAVPANSKVRHASFGANGMAWSDISSFNVSKYWELVAACDVDQARFDKLDKQFPNAKKYTDWRELLEKEGKNLDSVNVATPDHMHAPISMSAIHMGKHVYCQKPLTKWVLESRRLTEAAKKAGVHTQMGIQVHSSEKYLMAIQMIQSGVIGKVSRVHCYEGKSWGGTKGRPTQVDPVPPTLNWDLWLGVAPKRDYTAKEYHPSSWRRWQDFGTGTFGDMGCHIYDPVFAALGLTAPVSIRSEGEPLQGEQWPNTAKVTYTFPQTKFTSGPTIDITWYDGGVKPSEDVFALVAPAVAAAKSKMPSSGSIIIGDKGVMLLPHAGGPGIPVLAPAEKFDRLAYPKVPGDDHRLQFVDCVRGERKTTRCPFDYSGPLSETILLGNVAQRFPGQTLEWDAANLKVKNVSAANDWIFRPYRKGWEVPGIA